MIAPGRQGLFYDLSKADKTRPQILAAASRAYDERITEHSFSYVAKAPAETVNSSRVLLPKEPSSIKANGEDIPANWDADSQTCLISFPNSPEGVRVEITF